MLATLFLWSSGHFNTDPAIRTGVLVRRLRLTPFSCILPIHRIADTGLLSYMAIHLSCEINEGTAGRLCESDVGRIALNLTGRQGA